MASRSGLGILCPKMAALMPTLPFKTAGMIDGSDLSRTCPAAGWNLPNHELPPKLRGNSSASCSRP